MLADFIAKFTSFSEEVSVAPLGKPLQVYVDDSFCQASEGVGEHLVTEHLEEQNYAIKLTFKVTNNDTEYEALLASMTVTRLLGAEEIEVKADSQIIVSHVLGQFAMKRKRLKNYLQLVCNKPNRLKKTGAICRERRKAKKLSLARLQ